MRKWRDSWFLLVTACAFLLPFLIYGFWSYGCYGNILDGFRRISGVAVVAEQPVLDMEEREDLVSYESEDGDED